MKNEEMVVNTKFTMDELYDILHALGATSNHYDELECEKTAERFWKLRERVLNQIIEKEKNM